MDEQLNQQRISFRNIGIKISEALQNQLYFESYVKNQFHVADVQELHHNINNMAQIIRPSVGKILNDLITISSRLKQHDLLDHDTAQLINNIEICCKRIEEGEKCVAKEKADHEKQ